MPHDDKHIHSRDENAGKSEGIVVWGDFYRWGAGAHGAHTRISGVDGES